MSKLFSLLSFWCPFVLIYSYAFFSSFASSAFRTQIHLFSYVPHLFLVFMSLLFFISLSRFLNSCPSCSPCTFLLFVLTYELFSWASFVSGSYILFASSSLPPRSTNTVGRVHVLGRQIICCCFCCYCCYFYCCCCCCVCCS